MKEKQESPRTVCRPSKGSKLREISYHIIALITQGQVEKLTYIIALTPYCELLPAALLVSIAMGAI